MKKLVSTICIILLYSTIVSAQNGLSFEFDYARFNYDSSSIYIEFYYELNPKDMQLIPASNGSLIEAIVHIEMKNLDRDTFYIYKDWRIKDIAAGSSSEKTLKNLSGTFGFNIPEGKYSLFIKVYDAQNPQLNKTINETMQITPYKNDKFSISDIQLASNIKKEGADPNSIFYKNTFEVIPNPSMIFSAPTPAAFYYVELYNLSLTNPEANFNLQKLLCNSMGKTIYRQTKTIKQAKNSVVDVGVINLSKYPTDSYIFVLSLIDDKTNETFVSSKRFYLYNPGVIDSSAVKELNAGVMGSEFAILNAEECNKLFSQSKYIATQKEIDRYSKIDSLNAKKEFLYYFWKNRDADPSTSQNEFKQDYMKRIDYANSNFRYTGKEGYLTDRGRVYLIYGEPDQKDYFPYESNMKPYEVWFYNSIEGGVTFIFGDINSFGNYELLHSTKNGEVRDDNWMRRISSK